MVEVAAVVLAAGRGLRFGAGIAQSKVAAIHAGRPLVSHVVAAALASKAAPTIVVTGHAETEVDAALTGCAVTLVHNADHAQGLAGSLRAGLSMLPAACDGALILLGDMPLVHSATLDDLIGAFDPLVSEAVVPTFDGEWGNPVLIGRRLFGPVMALVGDEGARGVLKRARAVRLHPVEDPGVMVDVDTPDALRRLTRINPTGRSE